MVSCSADGVIAVTDLTTGDRTRTLRGHEGAVLAVAFDRSKIISASDDGTLRTWVWASRSAKQVIEWRSENECRVPPTKKRHTQPRLVDDIYFIVTCNLCDEIELFGVRV